MLIMHIVEKVFIPEVLIVLNNFTQKVGEQAVYKHEYKEVTGFYPALPPVELDLQTAQIKLADSIAIALKEYPPQN